MTFKEQVHQQITKYSKMFQQYVDRIWYPPLLAILAALDNFLVVIPNDGILVSSSMLIPKRWFIFALFVGIGSTIGAMTLATLANQQGLPWILDIFPGIDQTKSWVFTLEFFQKYGLLMTFAVSISPFVQQPAVILAALAHTNFVQLAIVIFAGRFIKFLIMAYVASHAPRLLSKMWGIKGELQDVGVKVNEK
jgi:membrane protein YqaA with SNARE-associated domain